MTLYELLKKVSFILAKGNADKLFEYTIHSMYHNCGFLRSRYCYWEETLSDYECGCDLKTILVTLSKPFDFCKSTQYYEEGDFTNLALTSLKMQIFLYNISNKKHLEQLIRMNRGMGFSYPIKVDLINESFEILPARNLNRLWYRDH